MVRISRWTLAVLLLASGCSGAVYVPPPALEDPSPAKWQQYCTSPPPDLHTADGVNAWLSRQGESGWELVSKDGRWYCFRARAR